MKRSKSTTPSMRWFGNFADKVRARLEQRKAWLRGEPKRPDSVPNDDERSRSDIRKVTPSNALQSATASAEIELHVIQCWKDFIRNALAKMGVLPAELEDVTDIVIDVVSRKWLDYQPERATRAAWIKGFCLHVYMNHRRNRLRMLSHYDAQSEISALASTQPDPELVYDGIEARDIVFSILELMKNDQLAEIWWLHHYEEFAITTLSELYRIEYKAAWRLLQKANASFEKAKALHDSITITQRYNVRKVGGK